MKLNQTTYSLALAVGMFALNPALHAGETDSRIESSAKKSYVFKTYLKEDSIKVKSRDGIVTLTGTVNEESHRSLAEDTVAGLPGVIKVENELDVKGERTAETKGSQPSDTWIAAKVKSTLLFHRNVSVSKTEVSVKDGYVTLAGLADSQAQKDLTTTYARDVEGVRDVNNVMTVASTTPPPAADTTIPGNNTPNYHNRTTGDETVGEKIDDASITAQVKMSLASHRSTSALRTKVETRDGIVTLSGNANNPAEKDLVGRLVSEVKGVRRVENAMVVVENPNP